jgi:hypothetical protein
MNKRIVRLFALFIVMITLVTTLLPATVQAADSGKGRWYELGSGWKIRIDPPDTNGKPYYHIHFYYKNSEKGCLRLDNLKTCDNFNNKSIPKWVEKAAKQKAESRGIGWGYNISKSTINWGRALALVGCSILVIIATICPFDGIAGDATAWGLLLGII